MVPYTRFVEELTQYLRGAQEARQRGLSHDHRRHLFLRFIEHCFDVDREEVELEKGVKALKLHGRIDLLFRDLVFEFKRDLVTEREVGEAELAKYLGSAEVGGRGFGILTDGIKFRAYLLRGETLIPLDDWVDLKALADQDPHVALLWLDSFLFARAKIAPKSDDVVRRFGAGSPVFAAAAESLRAMFEALAQDGSTQVKFIEWNKLLAKVYGNREVGTTELFLRHTYLSIVAKTFAYLALFRRPPQAEESLTGIVSGETFQRRNLPDLAEEDFFAWVLGPSVRSQALNVLRGLVKHLSTYDASKIHEDLLKELYQGLVDPETRHDLGEFYTPDWLAELTLREAGYKGKGSVLDPACGSGTFLFTAIRMARESGGHGAKLASYVQANIMGVDVHPLAVTVAKANYALALAPDLKQHRGNLTIPVYMADALLHEEKREDGAPIKVIVGVKEREVRARNGKKTKATQEESFRVPAVMARHPALLDAVVEAMCEHARKLDAPDLLVSGFREYLAKLEKRRHAGGTWGTTYWQGNLRLMIDLVRQNRDTIWGFIVRNAYRPVYLSDRRFDFVVGNPPWLAYRYIQDPRYQLQVKELCFGYELLERSEVNLFTVIDTSTLFFEFCYDRYLNDKGVLAFVMPKSVLTGAKQHRRFQRNGFTSGLDLEEVSPLFNVPACVLVRGRGKARTSDVPMVCYTGALPEKNVTWGTADALLAPHRETYIPHIGREPSHYWQEFRAGASIFPRCFWFVRTTADEEWGAVNHEKPYLETTPDIQKDAKTPWKGMQVEGEVESDFLYATLLGRNLLPFGNKAFDLVVLPLLATRRGRGVELLTTTGALGKGYPWLARWLLNVEEAWNRDKKSASDRTIYQRLDYQHTLTTQSFRNCYKVLYNTSGTHLASCVVNTNRTLHAGGLKVNGFAAEMVTYYLETTDEAEAHYLCAVLNSPFVNEAIKGHQARGQWGERHITRLPFEVLPIPKYDPSDEVQQRLAEISMDCHHKVARLARGMTEGEIGRQRRDIRRLLRAEIREIDDLVQKLLSVSAEEAPPKPKGIGTPDLFG